MKLLIGGSSTFMFHLQEFTKKLNELGVETRLVFDADYADGFPSRKMSKWFGTNNKFKKLIGEFKPDLILVDRQRHFGLEATRRVEQANRVLECQLYLIFQWEHPNNQNTYFEFDEIFLLKHFQMARLLQLLPVCLFF